MDETRDAFEQWVQQRAAPSQTTIVVVRDGDWLVTFHDDAEAMKEAARAAKCPAYFQGGREPFCIAAVEKLSEIVLALGARGVRVVAAD